MGDAFLDAPVVEMERLFEQESFPENIVVTGNHVSTVEMAQFFRLIGRRVTLVTNSNYFLDGLDAYLVEEVTRRLASDKIELIKEGYPEKYAEGHLVVGDKKIKCELIVNCNSRKAVIPESEAPLQLTDRGFIKTDDRFRTNIDASMPLAM